MLLFEGQPLLFFLFSISILCLLIGGCCWGSGEDADNKGKMYAGIVIFAIGCATAVAFIIVYVLKRIRRRRKRKAEIERILRQQDGNGDDDVYSKDNNSYQTNPSGYENRGADLNDYRTQF
ncbi:unnamed protein product [Calicophoron daubneyi]|uniref:Uncharacterized protein n=1 Tax=Calicophoron daubneyi TaxID=300641 RepID=A0AAV2TJL9_CALDB